MGLMTTFFEAEKRKARLAERREAAFEHEMLEAANKKIAALEKELAKLKTDATEEKVVEKKHEFPGLFEKPVEDNKEVLYKSYEGE